MTSKRYQGQGEPQTPQTPQTPNLGYAVPAARGALWHHRYLDRLHSERAMERKRSPHALERDIEAAARGVAWGAVAMSWHREHGERVAGTICAGCGKGVGDEPSVITLADKARVHLSDDLACVIAYGRKWREVAARALAAYGIPAPSMDEMTAHLVSQSTTNGSTPA